VGSYKGQLELGVTLATISRIASNSINDDIRRTLRVIGSKTIEELNANGKVADEFYYL